MYKRCLAVVVALAGLSPMARAHPHIRTEMRSQLVVSDDGLITGVRLQWTTDKAYAKTALDGFKAQPDGNYSAADLQKLTEENLGALADYNYFTYVRFNDEKQKVGKAGEGQQIYNPHDGRLTLLFSVPLEKPLDPRKGKISLKIYDPEFYIAFDYLEDKPLLISKALPSGCSAELLALPKDEQIEQTRLMLAGKDKAWRPDEAEDFGALFAQAAEVKCT